MKPVDVSPTVALPTAPASGTVLADADKAEADKGTTGKVGPQSAPFGPNKPLSQRLPNSVDTVPGRQPGDTGNADGTV